MNTAYVLLFMLVCLIVVTLSFMTPMDRRVFMGFVLDSWRNMTDEVVYQAKRAKRWWDERQAKKSGS